jgi:hypothetical protein
VISRNYLHQVTFNFLGSPVLSETQPLRDPANMSVNSNAFDYSMGIRKNHVGCFTRYAR